MSKQYGEYELLGEGRNAVLSTCFVILKRTLFLSQRKIMSETRCPLCLGRQISTKLIKPSKEIYWDCSECGMVFLDKAFLPSQSAEKGHYMTHNNDVNDIRYQKFVSPIVDYVLGNLSNEKEGLDYGAGPGPVISYLLRQKEYSMTLYDPFFCDDKSVLNKQYDFIISCEVIEHFHSPREEFEKLQGLLKKNGSLIVMTEVYKDSIDFNTWYYHRDPTHVCFYRESTFEWIKNHFFLERRETDSKAVVFKGVKV